MQSIKSPSFKTFKSSSARASSVARSASKKFDTKPEIILRKQLWRLGYRYRKNVQELPGNPDMVLTKKQIAIFCDGDFWHGKNWKSRKARLLKGVNSEYWISKIESNIARDKFNRKALIALGYSVIRVWESDIKKNPEIIAKWIANEINRLHSEKKPKMDKNKRKSDRVSHYDLPRDAN